MVLLHACNFLFTGDHLAWDPGARSLTAHRDYCWYSWPQQLDSVRRLACYAFAWVLPGHGRRVRRVRDERFDPDGVAKRSKILPAVASQKPRLHSHCNRQGWPPIGANVGTFSVRNAVLRKPLSSPAAPIRSRSRPSKPLRPLCAHSALHRTRFPCRTAPGPVRQRCAPGFAGLAGRGRNRCVDRLGKCWPTGFRFGPSAASGITVHRLFQFFSTPSSR